MAQLKDLLAGVKDSVSALREAMLVIVFALLLLTPTWIKERLKDAGFTKGSIAGMEWEAEIEASAEQAKDAGQAITEIEPKLQQIEARLAELAGKTTDPSFAREIDDLSSTVKASQVKIREADQAVKSALSTQQRVLAEAAPAAVEMRGWMYLGKVDDSKTHWAPGSPTTIQPTGLPLEPGRTATIRDDVYLRDPDAGPGNRAGARIVGVARLGEKVRILEVDDSSPDTKHNGWFVWAKVDRVGGAA